MKLTKEKLQKIIKEELAEIVEPSYRFAPKADPDFEPRASSPGRDVIRETDEWEISKVDMGWVAEKKCDEDEYGGSCPSIHFKNWGALKDVDDDLMNRALDIAVELDIVGK